MLLHVFWHSTRKDVASSANLANATIAGGITIVMSVMSSQPGKSEFIDLSVALGNCLPRRGQLSLDVLVHLIKSGL